MERNGPDVHSNVRHAESTVSVSAAPPCIGRSFRFGLGGLKVPGQQGIERLAVVALCHAIDDGGDVGLGIKAVELCGLCRPLNYAERIRFLQKWP